MDKPRIAIFDSGVGGIPYLQRALKLMPREDFIYYADSAHTPYGDKTTAEVVDWVNQAMLDLHQYPLKAILITCTTSSLAALQQVQDQYSTPILGVVHSSKPAFRKYDPRRVLVFGTPLTNQLARRIAIARGSAIIGDLDDGEYVSYLCIQELVNFAEEFDFDSRAVKRYLRRLLSSVDWDLYHSIALECSHLYYFKERIKSMLPEHIDVLDGRSRTLAALEEVIEKDLEPSPYKLKCLLSGREVANEIIEPYLNYLDYLNGSNFI